MSSLLSTVTGTTDETASNQSTEQQHEAAGSEDGGSRRRILGLAAAGLGTAYLLRRRASKRRGESQDETQATTGEPSDTESASGKQGRSVRGRLTRTVAGIAASVVAQRAIRRWRKQ